MSAFAAASHRLAEPEKLELAHDLQIVLLTNEPVLLIEANGRRIFGLNVEREARTAKFPCPRFSIGDPNPKTD
jgi:hypothetical protein